MLQRPNQPGENFLFPTKTFSNKQRHFCTSGFERYKWLHYDEENDKPYYFVCIKVIETNNIGGDSACDSFVQSGYDNWKKALEKGRSQEAVVRYKIAPSSAIRDIFDTISTSYAGKRLENNKMFFKILSNLRFLGLYTSIIAKTG